MIRQQRKPAGTMISVDAFIVSNLIPSSDPAVSFKGFWGSGYSPKFTAGLQKFSSYEGDYAEFTFTGTRVALLANTGKNLGKANIYLDGVLVTLNR